MLSPGSRLNLLFRLWIRWAPLNAMTVMFGSLAGYGYAPGDGRTEEPPRFHTAVWFADPVIGEQGAVEAFPSGKRPHEITVEERHNNRLPLVPRGQPMRSPARLRLVTPAAIPKCGFPITCGVPMPPGVLRDVNYIRLLVRLYFRTFWVT